MFKYKIWDKKEPINGASASKVLESREEYKDQEVILIYDESKPYRISYIQTSEDHFKEEGDTVDNTARRCVEFYNKKSEAPTNVSNQFTSEQMEVVNQMIQQAISNTVDQITENTVLKVQESILDAIVPAK